MKKRYNLLIAFLLIGTVFLIKPGSVQGQVNCKPLVNPAVTDCNQGEFAGYPVKCSPTGATGALYCCKTSADCSTARTAINTIPPSSLENFDKKANGNEMSMEKYLGGKGAYFESALNSATREIIGKDINWTELRAGNYQKANIAGALGFGSNLVAQILTTPPVSSKEYFADLGKNFGLAKPVYAQGAGFIGLQNLLPLWKASRNLAYIFFVIVFLATGLLIMFRVKLDPKTVINIQSAIPKLVIALLLVTFSYAIVGLLLDLSYVLIALGVLAIGGPLGLDVAAEQAKYMHLGLGDAFGLIFGGIARATFSNVITGAGASITAIISVIIGVIIASVSGVLGAVVAALPILVISIVVLIEIFKLFFTLLGCYIQIILAVIIAPIQIMLGVVPGSNFGFGAWFKNIIANILVFPAVSLFFLLGWLLTSPKYGPTWVPPVGFGGLAVSILPVVVGFGMIMTVNKIPQMVKSFFKMAKPVDFGSAIGETLGPAKLGARYVMQSESNRWQKDYERAGLHPTTPETTRKSVSDVLKTLGVVK